MRDQLQERYAYLIKRFPSVIGSIIEVCFEMGSQTLGEGKCEEFEIQGYAVNHKRQHPLPQVLRISAKRITNRVTDQGKDRELLLLHAVL